MTPDQLTHWRGHLGFSQSAMATLLGVPVKTLRNWEQGQRRMPAVARRHAWTLMWLWAMHPKVFEAYRTKCMRKEG